jgi:hypothetical protein
VKGALLMPVWLHGTDVDLPAVAAYYGSHVRTLINEAVETAGGGARLWIIGVDDPHHYGCDDLEGAGSPPDSGPSATAARC